MNVACFVQSCLTDADFVLFSNYCLIGTRLRLPLFGLMKVRSMPEQEVPEAGGGQEQDQHDHGHHIAHHHAIQLGPAEMLAVFLHLVDDPLGADDPANQDAGEEADKGHQEAVADVVHHVQKLSGAAVGQGQLEVEHVVAKADGHGGHQRADPHQGAHLLAALVEDLHAVGHQRFHDGYTAGQCREAKGQEEHDADDAPHAAHGGKHPGQADEGQAGSAGHAVSVRNSSIKTIGET